MFDFEFAVGLLVSIVLTLWVTKWFAGHLEEPDFKLSGGTLTSPDTRDRFDMVGVTINATAVGFVVGKAVYVATSGFFPGPMALLVANSSVNWWAGAAAASIYAIAARTRFTLNDNRVSNLGSIFDAAWFVFPAMAFAVATWESTCVARQRCYGPATSFGLVPEGFSGPVFPLPLVVGLALGVFVFGVHRFVRTSHHEIRTAGVTSAVALVAAKLFLAQYRF